VRNRSGGVTLRLHVIVTPLPHPFRPSILATRVAEPRPPEGPYVLLASVDLAPSEHPLRLCPRECDIICAGESRPRSWLHHLDFGAFCVVALRKAGNTLAMAKRKPPRGRSCQELRPTPEWQGPCHIRRARVASLAAPSIRTHALPCSSGLKLEACATVMSQEETACARMQACRPFGGTVGCCGVHIVPF
jgi:hypothetical protein